MPPLRSDDQPVDVYQSDPVTPLENQTPQQAYTKKKAIFRAYQVIWYILGIIEVLLAFRFFLRLVGANPNSGFTDLIYTLSAPFALPFRGIVSATVLGSSVIEWPTIIAMLVYLVIAYGVVKLFQLVKPTDPVEVQRTVDRP
ncbi:MAG: YggT family protein [Candidatus Andersenbacteria bacterium]|nr:YggT family protein [Candidatus Andersenbacteria bacterium]